MRLIALATLLTTCAVGVSAENWAVHVPEGVETAQKLAADHDVHYLGEVLPDSNIYHFKAKESNGRSKRSLSAIDESLRGHEKVKWAEQQEVLVRKKRGPLPEPQLGLGFTPRVGQRQSSRGQQICFVNTVKSETREPKRCIFPFQYKDKTYLKCTADHSDNGAEWCATEVRPDGEVVPGQWGDCDQKSFNCFVIEPNEVDAPRPPPRGPPRGPPPRGPPRGPPRVAAPPRQRVPLPPQRQSQLQFAPRPGSASQLHSASEASWRHPPWPFGWWLSETASHWR